MESLDALTKFHELWAYSLVILGGNDVPNYLRYSIGEEILKELKQIGYLIDYANKQTKHYDRIKSAREADRIFQQVKFDFNLMLYHKALAKRRGHLYELEAELGKMLGGWLNYLTSNGERC